MVRADAGGFLTFHTRPGELVEKGQILASTSPLLGSALGPDEGTIRAVNIERFEENGIDRVRADLASSVHVQTKRSVD